MLDPLYLLVFVIILALIFDFTNGWHDTANAIATVIGTRTLSPVTAVAMASVLNLAGAFFSTEVAKAIANDIVKTEIIKSLLVLVAALLAVIIWNIVTVLMGLPTSSSHALIGSLVGAAVAYNGFAVLKVGGIMKILIALILSPVLGGIISFIILKLVKAVFANVSPTKAKRTFRVMQVASSAFMAFSHGASDAQKAVGIIVMALMIAGQQPAGFEQIPYWTILVAGSAMALGTAMGGWRIIRTMGSRLSRLETHQGFAAETGAALLLTTIAKIGVPVSTTHTITGSIIGVGLAERVRSVRWGIAGKIVYAWILTLPATAVMGFVLYMVLRVLE